MINALAKLHSFLVDTRDDNAKERNIFRQFNQKTMDDLFKDNSGNDIPLILVVDNGQPQLIGKKSKKH